jgi:WD40 repeat protein
MSLAASGYDGSIRLWDLATGAAARLCRWEAGTPKSLVWLPDGSGIFWSWGPQGTGGIGWSALDGRTGALAEAELEVGGICLSPDARVLFASTRSAIKCWDVDDGTRLSRWRAPSPGHLAISPDGRTLASTHPLYPLAPIDAYHISLWDISTGRKQTRLVDCKEYFQGIVFSPDGTRLAALANQSLWLWEIRSKRVLAHHSSSKFFTGLAYSPDARLLATSSNDGSVRFWDGASGDALEAFDWKIGKVMCVAFAPDGMRAAAGGSLGDVIVWDVD